MKVALVGARNFPAMHGGLEVAVEEIALRLVEDGHEVHVFAGGGATDIPGLIVHRSPSLPTKHLHTASQVLTGILLVRRVNADVVHVHGVGPAFPLCFGARVFGAPTVATAHGIDWNRSKWGVIAAAVFRHISVHALKRAAAVTAVSQGVASDLQAQLSRRVDFVPNGVAVDASEGIPHPKLPNRFAVTIGRITPEKKLDWLVSNYSADVAEKFGPLVVIGSGSSSHSEDFERRVRSIPNKNVLFLGALNHPDTLATLKRATVYVSASEIEAQPISVMEAMKLHVPLCLSDIAEHKELAQLGASYFSRDDPSGLIEAMTRSTADEELTREAGRIADQLTWSHAVSEYQRIYESLAAGGVEVRA
ncbi:glycosyltransferase family 4 protein [Microbacterium testaceum]|uniref:D-inositol 3-phosphate glycosyltransferase n=1 Tax=Microbacterium testaceum TaxID=2033 RepID=A0A2T7VPY7_MICTE|nr:glycosyltransferase family 4 protein [Microbacterium testaceum]PVE58832.1 hypothetical protein DC432_15425 [Microbacterium testaceum]